MPGAKHPGLDLHGAGEGVAGPGQVALGHAHAGEVEQGSEGVGMRLSPGSDQASQRARELISRRRQVAARLVEEPEADEAVEGVDVVFSQHAPAGLVGLGVESAGRGQVAESAGAETVSASRM